MPRLTLEQIEKACNHINNISRRQQSNYVVVSPKVADVINNFEKVRQRKSKINKLLKRIKNNQ
jgi:hypothetical protein